MDRPTYEMPYHHNNPDDETDETRERDESSFEPVGGSSESAEERDYDETREPDAYPSDVLGESEGVRDESEAYATPEEEAFAAAEAPTINEEPLDVGEPVGEPAGEQADEQADAPVDEPAVGQVGEPVIPDASLLTAAPLVTEAPAAAPDLPETPDFGQRWHEIKASFVDDPRQAVEQADALVEEAVNALTTHRKALSDRLQNTDTGDTEQLRQTLREYHALFDRLNSGK